MGDMWHVACDSGSNRNSNNEHVWVFRGSTLHTTNLHAIRLRIFNGSRPTK